MRQSAELQRRAGMLGAERWRRQAGFLSLNPSIETWRIGILSRVCPNMVGGTKTPGRSQIALPPTYTLHESASVTTLPGDIIKWLEMFAQPFLAAIPERQSGKFLDEVHRDLVPDILTVDARWMRD